MKLILSGGGRAEQTTLANELFVKIIDNSKPLLYVPLAMSSERYPSCLEWITNEFKNVNLSGIAMVNSSEELAEKELSNYCAIFIGGGNTYKLLSELKATNAFNKIQEFIKNGGIIYGGSAGSIIMGYSINSCLYMDENEVALKEINGFNATNGFSLVAHYTNKTEEKTKIATDYLTEYTKKNEPVLALPEEDSLYINDDKFKIIGTKPCYLFKNGKIISIEENSEFTTNKFQNL